MSADPQPIQEEKISIREFARRLGVRDTSVHKAIKAGKIVEGVEGTGTERRILYHRAMIEWGQEHDPTYASRAPGLAEKLATVQPQAPPPAAGGLPGAAQEGEHGSLAQAKRLQALLKVQQMKLELQKLQGSLIDKAATQRALHAAGEELKTAILTIPDRVIDDLMAQNTRADAYTLLHDVLADTLRAVAETLKRALP